VWTEIPEICVRDHSRDDWAGSNSNNLGSSSKISGRLGRGSEGSDLPSSPLEGVLRTYPHKIAKADSRANRQL
jgi:hypothetical protein